MQMQGQCSIGQGLPPLHEASVGHMLRKKETTSQEELSSATLKDKGIEADQRTPGEEELSKR